MSSMKRYASLHCSVALLTLVCAAGCNRKEQVPPSTAQSATPEQAAHQPVTVIGCLKVGDAADTFVLTAAKAATGEQTSNYQLIGSGGVNLADHVGHQVEVSGVVTAQQEVQARSSTDPARNARGTSGTTPSVSTTTELDIKKLNVNQVRRVADECRM